jgi:hypothetical protein
MVNLGEKVTPIKLRSMIQEVDTDNSGTVEFAEFVGMMQKVRLSGGSGRAAAVAGGASAPPALYDAAQKTATMIQVEGGSGGSHSYSEDERIAFAEHLSQCLAGDADLTCLPIDPRSDALFTAVRDGVLLVKLINKAVPDTIDTRAVNLGGKKRSLNVYEVKENLNLVINAAKAIGCVVVNVHNTDLMEGKPHIVLGLIWQIVKIQ